MSDSGPSAEAAAAPLAGMAAAPTVAEPLVSAGRLVGLLADPARLRVVAALVLGATTTAEITAATGLTVREVAPALARLVDAEVVERGADGTHVVIEALFAAAARAAAPPPAPAEDHGDATAEAARVLRVFVRDGRLLQIPTQRSKRLVILDLLAQELEPGRRYSEAIVNLILGRWHADTASLRRYLVDEGFLSRANGEYWRSGGSVRLS